MARFGCGNLYRARYPLRKHSRFLLRKRDCYISAVEAYSQATFPQGRRTSHISAAETSYVSAVDTQHDTNFRSGNEPFLAVRGNLITCAMQKNTTDYWYLYLTKVFYSYYLLYSYISLSIYLFIYLLIFLFIHLFIYFSIFHFFKLIF